MFKAGIVITGFTNLSLEKIPLGAHRASEEVKWKRVLFVELSVESGRKKKKKKLIGSENYKL